MAAPMNVDTDKAVNKGIRNGLKRRVNSIIHEMVANLSLGGFTRQNESSI